MLIDQLLNVHYWPTGRTFPTRQRTSSFFYSCGLKIDEDTNPTFQIYHPVPQYKKIDDGKPILFRVDVIAEINIFLAVMDQSYYLGSTTCSNYGRTLKSRISTFLHSLFKPSSYIFFFGQTVLSHLSYSSQIIIKSIKFTE